MKKNLMCGLAAAAFAMGFAAAANAVPIYLDFTGKVTVATVGDEALLGTSMSGGFSFETDNMFVYDSSGPARQLSFTQFTPAATSDPLGYLNIGSERVTWAANPYNGYGGVVFVDACAPVCVPGWGENLSWNAINNDFVSGADGTFTSRSLGLISANTIRYPDYPFVEFLDYFDANDVTAVSGVTLPLYELVGVYSEEKYTCVGGECQSAGQRLFNFSVDGVTRGVGPRDVPVPEPGTFGLFAAAALGALVLRRRGRWCQVGLTGTRSSTG